MKLDISYQPTKVQIPQLSESNFTEVFEKIPQKAIMTSFDVISQYLVLKLHIL